MGSFDWMEMLGLLGMSGSGPLLQCKAVSFEPLLYAIGISTVMIGAGGVFVWRRYIRSRPEVTVQ